jgi:hypothetical protein
VRYGITELASEVVLPNCTNASIDTASSTPQVGRVNSQFIDHLGGRATPAHCLLRVLQHGFGCSAPQLEEYVLL